MIPLEVIAAWVETLDPEFRDHISAGLINGNEEKWIGIYDANKDQGKQRICLGGAEATHFYYKQVSILIHWTKEPSKAEQKAIQLYQRLYGLSDFPLGDFHVVSIDPGASPISVGRDSKNIYEYVINTKICYEKEDT